MRKVFVTAAAIVGLVAIAGPASAAIIVNPPGTPAITEASCGGVGFSGITELACAGGYSKNLLKGSVADPGLAALEAIGYVGGANYVEKLSGLSGTTTIDFATLLTGITYIGIHTGNGGNPLGNATNFFEFDAGGGVDSFTINIDGGLSDAAIFSTDSGKIVGVPEPSAWALLILGFGFVGAMMRVARRRGLPQIA